jgi:hypothetical protein
MGYMAAQQACDPNETLVPLHRAHEGPPSQDRSSSPNHTLTTVARVNFYWSGTTPTGRDIARGRVPYSWKESAKHSRREYRTCQNPTSCLTIAETNLGSENSTSNTGVRLDLSFSGAKFVESHGRAGASTDGNHDGRTLHPSNGDLQLGRTDS